MAFLEAYNVEVEIPNSSADVTFDLSVNGETRTPIAAMFMLSNCTSYGSETANEFFLTALCTADGVAYTSIYSKDAQGTISAWGRSAIDVTGELTAAIKDESGTNIIVFRMNSTGAHGPKAGGWVVDATTQNLGTVAKCVATLFFGEGRSAEMVYVPNNQGAGSYNLSTSIRGDVGIWIGTENQNGADNSFIGIGYHSGTSQASFGRFQEDNAGTSSLTAFLSDEDCFTWLKSGIRTGYQITAVNDTSLDFTIARDAGAADRGCAGLIFDLPAQQSAYVGVHDWFTAGETGEQSFSAGFRPQWAQFAHNGLNSVNSEVTNAAANFLTIAAMDNAGQGVMASVASGDNLATTDSATSVEQDSGGGQWVKGFNTNNNPNLTGLVINSYTGIPFDSDGFVLRDGEYSTSMVNVKKVPIFALEAAPVSQASGYNSSLKLLWQPAQYNSADTTAVNGESSVTFTATGGAGRTYYDSSGVLQTTTGNELRYDHDPATNEALGVVCEAAFQNELLRSEEIDHATWQEDATGPTVTPNDGAAPDGTTTAEKIEDTGSVTQRRFQDVAISGNPTFCFSVYVLKDAIAATTRAPALIINFRDVVSAAVCLSYDSSTGEYTSGVTAGAPTIVDSGVEDCGTHWRPYIVATDTQSNTTARFSIFPARSQSLSTTSVSSASGFIHAWGAQATQTPVPVSYFKTTGTADGPNDDQPFNGTDVQAIMGATGAGVYYCNYVWPVISDMSTSRTIWSYNTGSADTDRINHYISSPSELSTVTFKTGGSGQATPISGVEHTNLANGVPIEQHMALRIATNDVAFYERGFSATDGSAVLGSGFDELAFGDRWTPGGARDAYRVHIKEFRYYDDTTIPNGGPQDGEDALSLYNLSMGLVNESPKSGGSSGSGGSGGKRRRMGAIWKR